MPVKLQNGSTLSDYELDVLFKLVKLGKLVYPKEIKSAGERLLVASFINLKKNRFLRTRILCIKGRLVKVVVPTKRAVGSFVRRVK